jgi:diketogulonate reductase-like aldo/keto reductase
MSQIQIPALTLNDGVTMPQLGFGVFQVPPTDTAAAVTKAFEFGYRHVDTAAIYRNEAEVGEAIAASDLARDELFVTTKLWNAEQGYDTTLRAFDASMEKLGLDVLDLYLIHWPLPSRDKYVDSWKALVQLKEDGRVRSIGVSNFQPAHLRRLLDEVGVVPSVNQVELHPYLQQASLRAFHAEHGIATEAWSPLAQGQVLDAPALTQIAAEHDKTAAQVVLRWHVEIGNVVIPKSVTPSRMAENLDIVDFALSEAELGAIAAIDRAERIGFDPDTMDIA